MRLQLLAAEIDEAIAEANKRIKQILLEAAFDTMKFTTVKIGDLETMMREDFEKAKIERSAILDKLLMGLLTHDELVDTIKQLNLVGKIINEACFRIDRLECAQHRLHSLECERELIRKCSKTIRYLVRD